MQKKKGGAEFSKKRVCFWNEVEIGSPKKIRFVFLEEKKKKKRATIKEEISRGKNGRVGGGDVWGGGEHPLVGGFLFERVVVVVMVVGILSWRANEQDDN